MTETLIQPIDAEVRQRVATELETTFLVEAGAGTGKTRVLVDRYVACLSQTDTPVAAVVAITFTEKAAGELRQRIRGRLETLLASDEPSPEVRERLTAALGGLDDAPISTIHAFAARLLRERPVEAGVDPAFTQLDQVGSDLLRERLWRDWLSGLLDTDAGQTDAGADADDGGDADAADADAAAGPAAADAAAGPAAVLAEILRAGVPIDQIEQLARVRFAERFAVVAAEPPTAPDLAAAIAAAKLEIDGVLELAGACTDQTDRLKTCTLELIDEVCNLADEGDPHELGRALVVAGGRAAKLTRRNVGRAPNWPGGKEAMTAARDALRDRLVAAAGAYTDYVAGLALAVAADFARTAAEAQLRAGALDFDDLLGRARDLLAGTPGADPAHVAMTRGHFQRRYRYLLVDEFQDTDPLQAEMAFLLAEREPSARPWRDVELAPGKLFLVGDPKQSIYRFRRADIGMYDEVRALVERHGGEVVRLRQNFRTVASIVSWANGVFGELMPAPGTEGLQPAYSELAPWRADPDDEPCVVVVRPPAAAQARPADDDPAAGPEAEAPDGAAAAAPSSARAGRPPRPGELCRREARFLAGLLADIEHSGWRVRSDDDAGWRAATLGDVALLLATFTHVGHYEQALREAGLPYRVDGGRTFYGRREVLDTLAVLRALDTAADPVAVYGALHGQLFAFSDDDLYRFHAAGGAFDYLDGEAPGGYPEIAGALADLRALHELRNARPPAETIDDLVRRTCLFESLALWADDPEQAIANVAELVSLADEFAHSTDASFHAFVAKMSRDVAAADTAESPVGESGDFVRLMTVHKAKGLEFPVVVLAAAMLGPRSADHAPLVDRAGRRLLCELSCQSPDPVRPGETIPLRSAGYDARHAHEKRALELERVRVLYVALTRAADVLVLPLAGDDARAGSPRALLQNVPAAGLASGGEADADRTRAGAPESSVTLEAGAGQSGEIAEDVGLAAKPVRVQAWAPGAAPTQSAPPTAPSPDPPAAREAWREERVALLARASRAAPIFAPSSLERLEPPDWPDTPSVRVASSPLESVPSPLEVAAPSLAALPDGQSVTGAPLGPLAVPSASLASPRGREHALALGSAVHDVLEHVSLADDSRLDELAARAAEDAGLESEAGRVAALARACWRAAPLRAAARSDATGGACRRELPVCVQHGAALIEGAIDLVYRDDELGGWVVVDYKTDARTPPEAVLERYGGQAGAYALAFEAASGQQVVAVAVLLAAAPDADGAATVVNLPVDDRLRELVEARIAATAGPSD